MITLGIIGVVAALTLPQLIQNHKKVEVETKLKRIYSIMNQAILESENDNGPQEYWECPSSSTEFVNKYLISYLGHYITETTNAYGGNYFLIYLNDGSLLAAKQQDYPCEYVFFFYPNAYNYDKSTFSTETSTDQYSNERKENGISFFAFIYGYKATNTISTHHFRKGFEPSKRYISATTPITKQSLTSGSSYSCNKNASNRAHCTALIQLNGWRIPKDYPFKVR